MNENAEKDVDDDDDYQQDDQFEVSTDFFSPAQEKIANERDKLHRPESESSNDYDAQVKLQHAMLKRQTLLDRIRQEQLLNDDSRRPRTYSPRRRYTPSPLPPPSRRSLPDLSRNYNVYLGRDRDMAQVKHVIEHKFRSDPSPRYQLPAIQQQAILPAVSYQQPVITQQITPAVTTLNAVPTLALQTQQQGSDRWFKKEDFMDMMMMQNAQMHHMVMQQLMVNNLPGASRPAYCAEAVVPPCLASIKQVRAAPTVYHHHTSAPAVAPAVHHYQALPPLDMGGYGRGAQAYVEEIIPAGSVSNNRGAYQGYYLDDGSNYYVYH